MNKVGNSMERAIKYDATNPLSIEKYAQQLIGKSFLDVVKEAEINEDIKVNIIDKYGKSKNKGSLGQLLEEHYFGYKLNSNQQADFYEAGVELKVSPYQKLKRGKLSAGERLVITMIGYDKPIELDFETSHVFEKIKILLLVYYLRDKDIKNKLLYPIDFIKLFSPPEEDMKIIKDDYEKIVRKIQDGRAHELSEGDTMYLGACTKGATAKKSTVSQYYGENIPARKRAFCFKNSYMTYILNKYIAKNLDTYEPIVQDAGELQHITFDKLVISKINSYVGYMDKELCDLFGREYNGNKSQWIDLAYRMLGIKSNRAAEFLKANIVVKAIRLEENCSIKESSSLPQMKLKEFINEEWEESKLRSYFEETKFLFVVFKKNGQFYELRGCQMWNMPYTDLECIVKSGWENVKSIVTNGVKLIKTERLNGRIVIENNLPGKKDNAIIHMKAHCGQSFYVLEDGEEVGKGNYSHAEELPDGRWMVKQSFWINNTYILKQLNENLK